MSSERQAITDAIRSKTPKALFFDLDGTLVSGTETVSADVIDALKRLASKGMKIAVATGRPWFGARHITALLPTNGISMFSGGSHFINTTNGTTENVIGLKPEIVQHVHKQAGDLGIYTEYYTTQGYYIVVGQGGTKFIEQQKKLAGVHAEYLKQAPVSVLSLEELLDTQQIIKIVTASDSPTLHTLQHQLAAATPNVSSNFSFGAAHPAILFGNIAAVTASRANAFEHLCLAHGVRSDEVFAFGDSPADATFLQLAGLGFAVGSFHPEAVEAADFLLPEPSEGGVIEVLNQLV